MFKRINKKRELRRITDYFNRKTANYRGEDIWDLRQFLMLLNLADNEKMGRSKAIIYAYKLGYIDGRRNTLDKIEKYLSGNDNKSA